MSNVIRAESPLVQTPASSASITEQELLGYINLRGVAGKGRTGFSLAIKKVTGLTPPITANTVVRSDEYTLYWLGPDEYLLLTGADRQGETIKALETKLDDVFSSVIDVSSGYCLLEVIGEYAEILLAKGCPLDLDSRQFVVGSCAQTVLAKANVIISPTLHAEGFEVIVRRSYADYVQRWLCQMNNGY